VPDLDPDAVADLDELCAHAAHIVEDTRPLSLEAGLPSRTAALTAITDRLVQAGVRERLADLTVTRWFLTGAPIADCLAIEANPPYYTTRRRPGVAQTHAPGSRQ
jgi:hypothetical protein